MIGWVADHRRHHAFSDREGDPHSPWRYGTGPAALAKGFWHAHMGWLFERASTNAERFAPDLLADRDLRVVDRLFPLWTVVSVGVPSALGGLITWSWWGMLTAFFWAGLVRVSFLHHADPTCARHGVLRGQIDISARVIWIFEKLRWVSDVRWTNPERLARITART